MIILTNMITLCRYLFSSNNTIEFENIPPKEDDIEEPYCECNMCYTVRNIIFFTTRQLKCKTV